ncbi:gamma-glutamyltranspeptidase 1-like isoform X2 [Myzus persicae]|uniref:gamma-glutamyltranspeptidase 1-like isoform X2 n=1 Tax=Myzus persicae TaxID=13164 RepID=UPI000B933473|nr:gamma-glutamyltranspeptidase 1-like isoform X2 [Myzus persicae]
MLMTFRLVRVGLVILTVVVSFLVVYDHQESSEHNSANRISDKELGCPPSSMLIAVSFNEVGNSSYVEPFTQFQSKPCIFLVVLIILTAIVSFLVLYPESHVTDHKIDDPEFQVPLQSNMTAGLYNKVGIVCNGGPCSQIGVDVMSKGGNAVDAAIATMLCDGVLCPEYLGIGGGFLMSIYNATTKKVITINARETAPAAASTSMFVTNPEKSIYGGLAIAVPGALKGYSAIYNLYGGGVPWESLFEPAIQLCENGIDISERLETNMKNNQDMIKNDPSLRELFYDEESSGVKTPGQIYKLPKLAETLRIIAKEGVDAIYNGSLTSLVLEDLKKVKSIITKEHLANYECHVISVEIEESFPVKLKSGHTIHTGPPPSSGIILAYILRVLDGMLPAPNAGLDAHRLELQRRLDQKLGKPGSYLAGIDHSGNVKPMTIGARLYRLEQQLSIMDKKLDQLVYLLKVQTHRQQFPALEEQV